jgi:hypothetical protein
MAMEGYGSKYPGGCSGSYAPFFPDEEEAENRIRLFV